MFDQSNKRAFQDEIISHLTANGCMPFYLGWSDLLKSPCLAVFSDISCGEDFAAHGDVDSWGHGLDCAHG